MTIIVEVAFVVGLIVEVTEAFKVAVVEGEVVHMVTKVEQHPNSEGATRARKSSFNARATFTATCISNKAKVCCYSQNRPLCARVKLNGLNLQSVIGRKGSFQFTVGLYQY